MFPAQLQLPEVANSRSIPYTIYPTSNYSLARVAHYCRSIESIVKDTSDAERRAVATALNKIAAIINNTAPKPAPLPTNTIVQASPSRSQVTTLFNSAQSCALDRQQIRPKCPDTSRIRSTEYHATTQNHADSTRTPRKRSLSYTEGSTPTKRFHSNKQVVDATEGPIVSHNRNTKEVSAEQLWDAKRTPASHPHEAEGVDLIQEVADQPSQPNVAELELPKSPPSSFSQELARLNEITYGLDSQFGQNEIENSRNKFYLQLRKLHVEAECGNRRENLVEFKEEECVDITNLLFTELVGEQTLLRVSSLIEGYNSSKEHIGPQQIVRAEMLAKHHETPPLLKKYFGSIARAALSINGCKNANFRHFNNVWGLIENVHTHKVYKTLIQAAEAKEDWLITHLKKNGFNTGKGVSWKTVTIRYLCQALEIPSKKLDLNAQQCESISCAIKLFGNGIIIILPVTAVSRIRKWGIQRMAAALALYIEVFPQLRLVCDMLDKHVYQPLVTGRPIKLDPARLKSKVPQSKSLQQMIEDAMYESSDN